MPPPGENVFMKKLNHASFALGFIVMASQLFAQNYTVLHNFTNSPDGKFPEAGLILSGNTLYGTTFNGGGSSNGTVFKIDTDGSNFDVLYNFSALGLHSTNSDGANPQGDLILVGDMLYGTTCNGGYVIGVSSVSANGTLFSINTNGTDFSVPFYIPSSQPHPHAGLTFDGNTFYGTTFGFSGGSQFGMAFKVGTGGLEYSTLKTFGGFGSLSVGWNPAAALLLDSNTLYGTTSGGGGGGGSGTVFKINTDGTGFTNLIAFSDGGFPVGRLLLNTNVLYGTTGSGGSYGGGSIFKINTDGTG
jgi:uncharacterized repeat protein (TIGR03803 family)